MLRRAVVGLCRWNASLEGSCPKWMSSAVAPLHEPHLDAQPVTLPSIEAAFHDRQISAQKETRRRANGIPLTTGRRRLVVLGTGWAACRLLRDIDPRKYDLTVCFLTGGCLFMRSLSFLGRFSTKPHGVYSVACLDDRRYIGPQKCHVAHCHDPKGVASATEPVSYGVLRKRGCGRAIGTLQCKGRSIFTTL